MDPVSAILTVLSLIPDLISTKGGRIIGAVYVGGKYYISVALERAFPIGGARRRRRAKTNVWLRYLKEFLKYVNRNYSLPNRMKIAKKNYERLKQSGQLDVLIKHHQLPVEIKQRLDQLMVITQKPPTISPEPGPLEFPFVFSGHPIPAPRSELEFPHIGLAQPEQESLEFPYIGIAEMQQPAPPLPPRPSRPRSSSAPAPELETAASQAAQEQIAETIAETVEKLPPSIFPETKQEIIAQNIQQEQQQLVSVGNLEALKPEVVTQAAADAAVVTGKIETISKAIEEATGVPKDEIKKEADEKKEVLETITNAPPVPRLEDQTTPPETEEEESKKKRKNRSKWRAD